MVWVNLGHMYADRNCTVLLAHCQKNQESGAIMTQSGAIMTPEQVSGCMLSLEASFCDMRDALEPFIEGYELSPSALDASLQRAKAHWECLRDRVNELAGLFEDL